MVCLCIHLRSSKWCASSSTFVHPGGVPLHRPAFEQSFVSFTYVSIKFCFIHLRLIQVLFHPPTFQSSFVSSSYVSAKFCSIHLRFSEVLFHPLAFECSFLSSIFFSSWWCASPSICSSSRWCAFPSTYVLAKFFVPLNSPMFDHPGVPLFAFHAGGVPLRPSPLHPGGVPLHPPTFQPSFVCFCIHLCSTIQVRLSLRFIQVLFIHPGGSVVVPLSTLHLGAVHPSRWFCCCASLSVASRCFSCDASLCVASRCF